MIPDFAEIRFFGGGSFILCFKKEKKLLSLLSHVLVMLAEISLSVKHGNYSEQQ